MCEKWASWGECEKNPRYMLVECRQSCKQCEPKPDPKPTPSRTFKTNLDMNQIKKYLTAGKLYLYIISL